MHVRRAAELLGEGLDYPAMDRRRRAGTLHRVRHGAYAEQVVGDAVGRHRALVAGTWPLLGDEARLSHATAAVWHGLPVWEPMLSRVHVLRSSGGHGRRDTNLHVHLTAVASADIVEQDGMVLTSLERTAVDVARSVSFERAVAVLDAALHKGADAAVLARIVAESRRCHGVRVARDALAFADGRAESVGESVSRVVIARLGLPAPELQFAVHDRDGFWLARSDFAWPWCGVIGEFDGQVKYRGSPDEVSGTVMAEKRREQAILDAGWTVVRWTWGDLSDPAHLGARLRVALAGRDH